MFLLQIENEWYTGENKIRAGPKVIEVAELHRWN